MAQLASTPTVASLCYDIDLVTTAAYSACTSCAPATTSVTSPANYCNTGVTFRAQDPINCVSFSQANYYCSSVGKRLPTDAEFEWAARGATAASNYPWGSTVPLGSDTPPKLCWNAGRDGYTGWPNRPTGTCPVGASDLTGKSPLGIRDLSGNVWEWTSTLYDASGYVVRGGGWDNTDSARVTAGFRNGPIPGTTSHYAVGFRCVATPS
jgi:formylglycine-generating enzyme required for sulfatase activity